MYKLSVYTEKIIIISKVYEIHKEPYTYWSSLLITKYFISLENFVVAKDFKRSSTTYTSKISNMNFTFADYNCYSQDINVTNSLPTLKTETVSFWATVSLISETFLEPTFIYGPTGKEYSDVWFREPEK